MVVYTYVKLPFYSFLTIIIVILALTVGVAVLGFRLGAMGAQIRELERRLEQVETGMADARDVFVEASKIRDYILRTAKCTPRQATEIAYQIIATARVENLDPATLTGMAHVESNFNPRARGRLGERDLLQVRPATFRSWHAGDLNDWRATFEAGARFFASCLRRFRALPLALAAYNAGPSRPPERILAISSRYADRILSIRRAIKGGRH